MALTIASISTGHCNRFGLVDWRELPIHKGGGSIGRFSDSTTNPVRKVQILNSAANGTSSKQDDFAP